MEPRQAGFSQLPLFACLADDNATIRVTNLSEDTRETDLQELFRPFGSISRIYLAKDKTTGQSKVGWWSWRGHHLSNCALNTFLPPFPRALPSSASTAVRMPHVPLLGCPASAMTTSFLTSSGPSKTSPLPHHRVIADTWADCSPTPVEQSPNLF